MTTTGPALALAPGTRTAPGTGANTGPFIHPELADERVFAALHYAGYHAWLSHVWTAAACTRPVRLRGDIKHIDPDTGAHVVGTAAIAKHFATLFANAKNADEAVRSRRSARRERGTSSTP